MSLRQLIVADRATTVLHAGSRRAPVTVTPSTDREEVARVIAKYNLLAVPVVDEGEHVLGIVTVDDVIDAIVREQTEDVQKFGGMEALDAPYMDIGLGHMIRKRARLALRAVPLRDAHGDGDAATFRAEIERAALLAMFIPLDHELRRQLRLASHVAHHSRDGARRDPPARLVADRRARAADRPHARHDPRRDRFRAHLALAGARHLQLRRRTTCSSR